MSVPGNTRWMFTPLSMPIFGGARCRCGDIEQPDGMRAGLWADSVRAEIAAGTGEIFIGESGVPVHRAR